MKKYKKNYHLKIIFSIISFYCIWNIISTQAKIQNQSHQLEAIKEKYFSQLTENKEYKNMISLETNEECIKRFAREKLGFIAQDDRVFIDISSK